MVWSMRFLPVSSITSSFYLLNYFKPATYQQTNETTKGRVIFQQIGCAQCHISDLQINHDRRVADLRNRLRSCQWHL